MTDCKSSNDVAGETPKNIQKYDDDVTSQNTSGNSKGETNVSDISSVVAAHYNALEEKGREIRNSSRIFYLRNFNNWIKSMLIKEYLTKIEKSKNNAASGIKVLDMCCGKGGDLFKWKNGNIKYLICADIAATSVEQCKSRHEDQKSKGWRGMFDAEFIVADCTRVRLREKYKDVTIKLDMVSCQFSFHYCFESLPQAECMLKNAAECLKPGGVFIGTIPDSSEIVKRVRKSGNGVYENDLLKIELCCEEPYPLFGAKYNFYLEGVVNCPEFLVYFPALVKLAAKFGFKLIRRESFSDFFESVKNEGLFLMKRMQAFEHYPPPPEASLNGSIEHDYQHAEEYLKNCRNTNSLGTLSQSEWEAISLYQIFAFEKVETKWNAEGKPEYDL